MDTHYSFINKNVQAYVDDDNDIHIRYNIVIAISFNGSFSGTTDVIVDESNPFSKRVLNKINFKIRTGAQETHELCWRKDSVEVTKSSNVSVPEIIQQTKLQNILTMIYL